MTKNDLKECLLQMPLSQLEVRVQGEKYEMVAFVISPDFIGQHEGIRQRQIWHHLLARLTQAQLKEFEFVFTFTPDEMAAIDRGERPVMQIEPLMTGSGG